SQVSTADRIADATLLCSSAQFQRRKPPVFPSSPCSLRSFTFVTSSMFRPMTSSFCPHFSASFRLRERLGIGFRACSRCCYGYGFSHENCRDSHSDRRFILCAFLAGISRRVARSGASCGGGG